MSEPLPNSLVTRHSAFLEHEGLGDLSIEGALVFEKNGVDGWAFSHVRDLSIMNEDGEQVPGMEEEAGATLLEDYTGSRSSLVED